MTTLCLKKTVASGTICAWWPPSYYHKPAYQTVLSKGRGLISWACWLYWCLFLIDWLRRHAGSSMFCTLTRQWAMFILRWRRSRWSILGTLALSAYCLYSDQLFIITRSKACVIILWVLPVDLVGRLLPLIHYTALKYSLRHWWCAGWGGTPLTAP